MKRKLFKEEDKVILPKMARMEIASDVDTSIISGSEISAALARNFKYQLSDKKAKSNLIKAAGRDAFVIEERQKCTMLEFNVGAYLQIVMPTTAKWNSGGKHFKVQDLDIQIVEVVPGYDGNNKHMETLIKFCVNGEKISVCCYNSTQRVKIEGHGYLDFMSKFLRPLFVEMLQNIDPTVLEKYNKGVIAALSGKRKAIVRPVRSVRYKAMAKVPCNKCENSFLNNTQLNKHRRTMHTRGANDSNSTIKVYL